ncbi:MAG: NAD(P)H-hydrate dehydratase [Flavobacteriales bacterium]|nr:NAD(P)H-hydrate dehydratase [Flavobacteriales bacterium]
MLPLLNAEQLREADAWTIAHEPIASIDLMERAAIRCVEWLGAHRGRLFEGTAIADQPYLVLCGPGNNGGDGLAMARILSASGHPVRVCSPFGSLRSSSDNALNRRRLEDSGATSVGSSQEGGPPQTLPGEVVIDALFGTGLSRPLQGDQRQFVQRLNAQESTIVSVDLPSGMFPEDNAQNDFEAVVRASWTLTFQVPKLAFLLPDSMPFVGSWDVLHIGLDAAFIAQQNSPYLVPGLGDLRYFLPLRPSHAHKGYFGHALLMAGGHGMLGAAVMAARAGVRSGVGRFSVHIPQGGREVLQAVVPEAMVLADRDPDELTELPDLERFSAVGIGPGIGTAPNAAKCLKNLIQTARVPLVVDADALNILAEQPTWAAFLPEGSVLTPHPGESDRLFGPSRSPFERLQKARKFAQRQRVVVVLKGARTATCAPDGRVFFNLTGNAGMAKGGSGDVLTGLLTGLLAQGMSALTAAMVGVHLHGSAGDFAAADRGQYAMTANDLPNYFPNAFRALRGQ